MTRRCVISTLVLPVAAQNRIPDRGPQIDSGLVKEFVIAGHGNLAKCREMLSQNPKLINACWDWGGGDFETALGGASHMGNREIALFLIEQGARIDLFAAAMLGHLQMVQAALEAHPGAIKTPGPHGIALTDHARKGGADAEATLRFLEKMTSSPAG